MLLFLGLCTNEPRQARGGTRTEDRSRERKANYCAAPDLPKGGSRRAAAAWHVTRPLSGRNQLCPPQS